MSTQMTPKKKGNGFLDGIDEKGTWLAKFFAKICTYGLTYAVIYLAIQSVLPQMRNGFIYGVAITIVFSAPEMMIGGLAVEAMEKFKGNKALGSFLFFVAVLFLSIGILTFVDIFYWHFKDNSQGQQMLSLYRAVVVLLYSAVHGIVTKMNEQREGKVQQVAQANDDLALANQKKIGEVATTVDTLASSVDKLVDRVDELYTVYTKISDRVDSGVDSVYKTELDRLSQKVTLMSNSVNQTNQTVLQITQNTNNLYSIQDRLQRSQSQNEVYTTSVKEVQDDRHALPETAETLDTTTDTDSARALPVPVLEVPGVSSDKVEKAISAYLESGSWRDVPFNYSRVTIHVRRAYEAYQESLSTAM